MTLAVLALDADGRGVARNPDGKVVFVEGALAGEIVEARLVRSRRSFDLMRATAVLQESSGRRAPRCAYFGVCGGCATQHADARTQVAAKQRGLEDCLQRIGKVEPGCILAPIHGEEWGYRRRARLSVRYLVGKGVAMVGFRERRSTFVADMDSCEVLPPRVAALIPGLRRLVASLSIRDRLPQIEVAVGDDAVALVFRHLLPLTATDETALRDFAQQTGLRVWLQPGGPDSAHPFAPESGPALHYTLPEFGVRIEFRPTDFTQVNHGVNRLLVARAVRLLDPQPGERIADLFCGLGNFALPMARGGAQVTGFEGSAGLVERARQNAALNGLEVRFESADLARHGIGAFGPFDKLLLDPPREGAVELIKALPPDWPRRIVYVSCDPATLARDAGVLVHVQGFALSAAGVLNMFPHTAHVESIALFER
ncbi:MAG: 23S rRNA (uracil(1939)-C(5))-methyltransferase RlmD [Betaproteobacteria bacterium]|nr:MAG: 23S rRNA (uracil(1939)-C(5))-methyltransferase RlmD [Betaproteobacteria bacterium]